MEAEVVQTEEQLLAVTEKVLRQDQIAQEINGLFDKVYAWLERSDIEQVGHNFAIYQVTENGLHLRVGFPVSAAFESEGEVTSFALPAGRAAYTLHRGSYTGLYETNRQLSEWLEAQQLTPAGLFWEEYGDWREDETQLETGVFIQLQDG